MLRIERVVSETWRQNGYVVARDGAALIVDPGAPSAAFRAILEREGLRPVGVIATHGHFDHLGGVADIIDAYALPFFMSHADLRLMRRANFYRAVFGAAAAIRIPERVEDLPATLDLAPFAVSVTPTPGHTEGSVCLFFGDAMFSGDTLLEGGLGRVDLPGGSRAKLAASARLIADLDRDYEVYPGHGEGFRLSAVRAGLAE